jgi:LysM repeat protein
MMFNYIVQPGDNLFSIARTFDVSENAILALNPGLLSNYVHPGIIIKIPTSSLLYGQYPWYIYNPNLFDITPRD